jgi:hypothetical protein
MQNAGVSLILLDDSKMAVDEPGPKFTCSVHHWGFNFVPAWRGAVARCCT